MGNKIRRGDASAGDADLQVAAGHPDEGNRLDRGGGRCEEGSDRRVFADAEGHRPFE